MNKMGFKILKLKVTGKNRQDATIGSATGTQATRQVSRDVAMSPFLDRVE